MRIIFFILLIFANSILYSQEVIDTYESDLKDGTFDIYHVPLNNGYRLLIEIQSYDVLTEKVYIQIKDKNVHKFINDLEYAKGKFIEWSKIAHENDVEDLHKEIPMNADRLDLFYSYGNDWYNSFRQRPAFEYKIDDTFEGLIIRFKDAESTENEFVSLESGIVLFSNPEEIDIFIDKISDANVQEKLNTPTKSDLFK